jgi:hypothetical protein
LSLGNPDQPGQIRVPEVPAAPGELYAAGSTRKNWLHVGSVKAGPKVAAILSIVESRRRLDVAVREYLAGVCCLAWIADR